MSDVTPVILRFAEEYLTARVGCLGTIFNKHLETGITSLSPSLKQENSFSEAVGVREGRQLGTCNTFFLKLCVALVTNVVIKNNHQIYSKIKSATYT